MKELEVKVRDLTIQMSQVEANLAKMSEAQKSVLKVREDLNAGFTKSLEDFHKSFVVESQKVMSALADVTRRQDQEYAKFDEKFKLFEKKHLSDLGDLKSIQHDYLSTIKNIADSLSKIKKNETTDEIKKQLVLMLESI